MGMGRVALLWREKATAIMIAVRKWPQTTFLASKLCTCPSVDVCERAGLGCVRHSCVYRC